MISKKTQELIVQKEDTISCCLKFMDKIGRRLLIVFNNNEFYGLLSMGDIQRAIIRNISLETPISRILRKDVDVAKDTDSTDSIKERMLIHRVEYMPVINTKNELVNTYFWEDIFESSVKAQQTRLNLPIVIMAGGKGSRLKPITNVLPKPLIPIGEKTIIEEIMDNFVDVGCNDFFISLNYKAEMIKHYFKELDNEKYNLNYFQEEKPLGTAGSLFLLKNKIHKTFFVSNCDIIIDQNLEEIFDYHKLNKNEITIISALKHYPIPYGTIETESDGNFSELKEKPELVFQINSGMYILEPHLIDEIPENTFFHITELISNIKKRNGKIGVFPVSEKSWIDIGTWSTYLKEIKTFYS